MSLLSPKVTTRKARLSAARLLTPVLVLALACTKDSNAPPPQTVDVSLLVAPTAVSLSEARTVDTVYLTAKPQGATVDWRVAAKPDWLTVTPSSGTVRSSVVAVVVSAPQLATMEPGFLNGRIDFIANGAAASIGANAVVQANPIVHLTSGTLTIPETSDTARVTLSNTGRGALNWSIASPLNGVSVSPASGSLATGQAVQLTLVADKRPLPVGTTSVSFTIKSNQKAGDVALPVSVVVPPSPVAVLSSARLVFAASVTTRTVWLRNIGKGALHWTASAPAGWGAVTPSNGTLAVGDSVALAVTVDHAAAGSPDATGNLAITSDAVNGTQQTRIELTGGSGLPLGLTVLGHRVVDAEYSPATGAIVTVSANPARLNIIDVESGLMKSVDLALPPACVAVQPDGRYAAVCHNGFMSYVDLLSAQVVKTYAVTVDALDAVLPGNGWMYVFPRRDQWQSIHNVALATGVESSSGTIYAGALARLNRAGTAMYVPTMGLSPSSVDKYSVANGPAAAMWGSPYWGEHSYGNVWLSEDGTRMYAASSEVFRASDTRGDDMSYAGSLPGSGLVFGAADSRVRGRAYIVSNDASYGLRVYDTQYLAFKGVVPLPKFPGASSDVPAQGRFVFANPDGSRVYVLEQADPSGGLSSDWGIAALSAPELP
ncbi:MAG: BACON domain-containing protein [Gemmatimonadaceae bacterium]|nr:BACON domain-containing protein [Gemmatimonadaceae bacterium]NUQ93342.1 BACON domain-containing protein [Gemmatimonadaceae bacterium]NUR18800.1 BACON domain-containing protein [Gemmatimonadaceae bacterium]NUS96434.1 BACON domain-containing protein [Gemmatimonadaceae bacterium]